MSNIVFEYVGFSKETGFHKVNQDFYGFYSGAFGEIYIVARGIGKEGSEIISHLAIITIKEFFDKLPERYNSALSLEFAIQAATKEVLSYTSKHQWLSNSGATMALVLKNKQGIFIAHAGDCRIFLVRKNKILNLTQDHFTYKDISKLTSKEDGNNNIEVPVIFNTIGMAHVEPDIKGALKFYKNDCLLLVTKGVYNRVTRPEMVKAFANKDINDGIKKLWDLALNRKSQEDFTLIALKVMKAPILPFDLNELKNDKTRFILMAILFGVSLLLSVMTMMPYLRDMGGG